MRFIVPYTLDVIAYNIHGGCFGVLCCYGTFAVMLDHLEFCNIELEI